MPEKMNILTHENVEVILFEAAIAEGIIDNIAENRTDPPGNVTVELKINGIEVKAKTFIDTIIKACFAAVDRNTRHLDRKEKKIKRLMDDIHEHGFKEVLSWNSGDLDWVVGNAVVKHLLDTQDDEDDDD